MRLTDYEKTARREIDKWQQGDTGLVQQALNWAMKPVDMLVERVSPETIDQISEGIAQFLARLNDASRWTIDSEEVLRKAGAAGLNVEKIEDLRKEDMEKLDGIASSYIMQNAVLAAVEGGGTGLGGALFIAADIPLLFGINFRLIQQIGASYGFSFADPAYEPLMLSIFNVATSGSREARNDALREISIAAATLASGLPYKGRLSGTFQQQNRHLPREIAKNLVGYKLGQLIPIAGAAVGAGVNFWFTQQTAQTAYMLLRAFFVEYKERL